ncbi:MAG: LytR/AlgR family response regulator transcription factor [Desulfovibrio sp.]
MAKLKTLILHPDPELRVELRKQLDRMSVVQVLGEAVSAYEALELLDGIPYGVFFIGTDLAGDINGMELAQIIAGRKERPALVFLAPDESQAYTAFELGATDYLIWPPAKERLKQTEKRLKAFKASFREIPAPSDWKDPSSGVATQEETVQLSLGEEEQESFLAALKTAWDQQQPRRPEIEKLAVNEDGRTILIPYTHIIFVEAYEDYSYVHTAKQKFLTSYRLKHLEDRLKPHRFFRAHRKYLVNLDMVTEIASLPGSNFMLRTAGRTRIELPISRRRISKLKQILGF